MTDAGSHDPTHEDPGIAVGQRWDVAAYERSFHFVTDYGRTLVSELLAPAAGERVLDLGCGNGELTALIQSQGADVLGLDGDAGMIARARERFAGVRFEQADAQDFELANEPPFDAVFSNAALHWMKKPAAVIANVRSVLRHGGRFVAEFGGGANVAHVIESVRAARRALGLGEPASPWFYPSTAEYATLLEHGGFFVRRIECFDRPTPLEPGEAGMAEWFGMFGGPLFSDLAAPERAAAIAKAVVLARPLLYSESAGRWVIDHVRLRFEAFRR
jgi:SAM-dependent methyltransferase